MKTPRELYEDWAPFIEFGRPQPPDTQRMLEEDVYVDQVANRASGINAGTPEGVPVKSPLVKRLVNRAM